MLFEIRAGSDPVHHCEKSGGVERGQDPVPRISVKVDGLRTVRDKCADVNWRAVVVAGDNDQERVFRHGYEGLRAIGVPFHKVQHVGQFAGFSFEDRHARAAAVEFERGEVVVPLAFALIDRFRVHRICRKHIAEGGEGIAGQGFGGDGHRKPAWRFTSL